uniref:Uncharacterized protein n=1 Tax=Anopheles atroparvus TaxID=41427 RepID=A0AAG5CT37_ANOAO
MMQFVLSFAFARMITFHHVPRHTKLWLQMKLVETRGDEIYSANKIVFFL